MVIEVVITSGGIDKLEAYKRLKIPEIWFWEDGKLSLYHLRTSRQKSVYEEITCSECLPELDLALLTRCINSPKHTQALQEFRQAIQA